MAATLKNAARILRNDGLFPLVKRSIRYGYNTWVRPLFPKRTVSYNGVSVRASHLGDSIIPWQTQDIPGYEEALVSGIRQYVESGDTVVIVGGGWGVSTVAAATRVGDSGQVITFEGGSETVQKVKSSAQLNSVENQVSVQHGIVGQAIALRGHGNNAEIVLPSKLPNCDVLVLDCEGAEMGILEKMEIRPQFILVETHGLFDSPKEDVRNKLDSLKYDIIGCTVAEERLQGFCEENSIYVMIAVDRQNPHDESS